MLILMKKLGPNKENFDQTRRTFLDIAREEFITHGYANASTTRIVDASGMARGSLYYHFKDKKDLFMAVYEDMMTDMATSMSAALNARDMDPWAKFIAACRLYFEVCTNPQQSRIILSDSQAVLTHAERHTINFRTIRPVMTTTLAPLTADGEFDGRNKEMLALFIFSTLGESGRVLQSLPNKEKAMDQYFDTFTWAMQKMR